VSDRRSSALELVEAANRCMHARDWEAMRALYHPRSRNALVASGGRPLGRDETIELLRTGMEEALYAVTPVERQAVGDHGAVVRSRIRYRNPDGFWADEERIWLLVEQDGLIYRTVPYPTIDAAEQAYAEAAPELGLPG
jgi:uncharacterized protein DUF4440